ncbi:MAG: hypothetical protein U0L52_09995 [Bacteroidaceae bacterium]|nr:hypothetical protein [Bacteroidaceae bacterium]
MKKRLSTVVALLCAATVILQAQNVNPSWSENNDFHFSAIKRNTEENFQMTVKVTIDEVRCDSAFEIGVFCEDECVLAKALMTNKQVFDIHYFYSQYVVNGEKGEKYTFRLYDHRNKVEVIAAETPESVEFVNDAIYGSLNGGLYELAFRNSSTHRSLLQLDDETNLPYSGTQYSITADGIECSYTRQAYLDGGFESIVLPFDADITDMKGAGFVFEKLETITETSIRFVELEEGENLKAGVAYIFRYTGVPSDGTVELTFKGNSTQVNDAVVNNNGWTGTFNAMDGNQIAGKYILNPKGDMMQMAGSGASLSPYHAYLELPDGMDMSRMKVIHNNLVSGIGNITGSNGEGERMYNLSGCEVNEKQYKGIVVSNRKKVLVK